MVRFETQAERIQALEKRVLVLERIVHALVSEHGLHYEDVELLGWLELNEQLRIHGKRII